MRVKVFGTAVATLAFVVALAGQDPAREQKLQQAIELLETKGNAGAAMPLLEEVAKSTDQVLAARALLYLGQAQERQGSELARKTYERIVKQFASQGAIVEQARARLVNLSSGRPAVVQSDRLVWTMPPQSLPTGRISSDGSRLLYVDNDGLHVRSVDRATSYMLIKDVEAGAVSEAVFSPDARRIAYSWRNAVTKGYELYTATLSASGVADRRHVTGVAGSYVWPLDWSTDGGLIAVFLESTPGEGDISVVRPDGGALRRLAKINSLAFTSAAFSPDGEYLAINVRSAGNGGYDIQLLPVGGGTAIPVVTHRADDVLVGWAAADKLLFTSDRSGDVALYSVTVRGGQDSDTKSIKSGIGRVWPIGSHSNRMFALKNFEQPLVSDIKVGALDFASGKWLTRPTDAVREYFAGANQSPEWSPDGRTLAYVSTRAAGLRNTQSISLRAEAAHVRELTVPLIHISGLRWVPDGTALLVWGRNFRGDSGWWRVDLNSGSASLFEAEGVEGTSVFIRWSVDGTKVYFRRVLSQNRTAFIEKVFPEGPVRTLYEGVRGPAAGQPGGPADLSPDGRKIYYRVAVSEERDAPYRQFAFMERDLTSGAEREIARGQLSGTNMSPDGQYLATGSNDAVSRTRTWSIISTRDGRREELFRMPLPDALRTGGSQNLDVLSIVTWSADSKSMLLRKLVGDKHELWWVPIDGRPPQVLDPDWRGASVRIHSDGRRIAYQTQAPPSPRQRELWVFESSAPQKR